MAMNASKDEDQKFSKFVEGIVTKAQTETKCENSDTLRDVIRTQIQTWLNEVENVNPLYKVSELIPVGSYAEGTKIIQPDEFDYLVVIEEFSKPVMIRIDTNEEDIRHGLVKIVVENEGLNAKCTGLCKDGHLKCFQPINYARLGEKRFGHVLIQTLWMIVKRSVKFSQPTTGSPTEIDCKIFLLTIYNIPLYFKGAEFMAPNVLIKFEYKTMEVTVDVSPAIRYHNIYDCFRQKDCAGPTFAELILSRKSLLFVGTDRKSDFKVTVTEAEVEYIQRVMKPEHKIIYIFLKYLLQLYKDVGRIPFIFTSYMMKTVCIHHDIKCEKNERSIKECFKLVMNELNDCTRQEYVVSIVNKNIRLTKYGMNMYHREFFLHGMEKMCQIPTDVTTVDDFDRYLKLIVQNEGQKKLKAEREIRMENEKYYESFCAELQEKVSKIVDMGYDPVEVEEVMKRYLYDSEQAILILQRRAKKREEEKLSQKFSSLSSHQIPAEDSPKQSTCEEGHPNGQSNELSDSSHTCQEQPEQSGKCLVALNSSQKSVTDEILNQRQKDI